VTTTVDQLMITVMKVLACV